MDSDSGRSSPVDGSPPPRTQPWKAMVKDKTWNPERLDTGGAKDNKDINMDSSVRVRITKDGICSNAAGIGETF